MMVSIRGQSAGAVTVGLILAMVFCATFGSPMMYKRNDQSSNFEADLIPVSSTVIPLSVYEVSYGTKDGKISEEEYKKIYMKNMPKKVHKHHMPGILDKLVTAKPSSGKKE